MLPFFPFPSLSSPVVLTPLLPPVCISLCPFANSKVLFYHFKCFKLPLGPSPPLALADLFWKPASPLQHPTSEAKETGRLWHVMVSSGRSVYVFWKERRERWDGAEVAENDKPVTNLISENCRNIEISWRINPHPWIHTFVQPVVLQNSCLLCCHGTDALYCLFVLVSALRNLCYLNY